MRSESIACRLRTLRKKSGLSQKELALILGFTSEIPVSRHERSLTVPSMLTALSYEVIFRVPAAEIFPGIFGAVEAGTEERLAATESELHQKTTKGRGAALIARKLEFLAERRNFESDQSAI